jgi:hypothetical protein
MPVFISYLLITLVVKNKKMLPDKIAMFVPSARGVNVLIRAIVIPIKIP